MVVTVSDAREGLVAKRAEILSLAPKTRFFFRITARRTRKIILKRAPLLQLHNSYEALDSIAKRILIFKVASSNEHCVAGPSCSERYVLLVLRHSAALAKPRALLPSDGRRFALECESFFRPRLACLL